MPELLSLWSRWQTTRITKRVQVAVRKKVFDHAVRLPLHRVYDLKSGGVASILREDAGGVADLIFSMIYNPWRAIIQLIGSLIDPRVGRLAAAAGLAGCCCRRSG